MPATVTGLCLVGVRRSGREFGAEVPWRMLGALVPAQAKTIGVGARLGFGPGRRQRILSVSDDLFQAAAFWLRSGVRRLFWG